MPRRTLTLLAAAGALAGGCGGGEEVTLEGRLLEMRLDEYRLIPQNVRAPAGRLTIVARNEGRLTHNVRVLDVPEDREARQKVIGGTPTAQPGQRVRGEVRLRPGEYRLACTIANHDDLGMYGQLTVVDDG